VAVVAGISVETLRKIETGRIPTPAFFTVVALARVLNLSLDDLSVDDFPDRAATVTKAS
jgi:transcriptional regulator with XRE-family HTH domain